MWTYSGNPNASLVDATHHLLGDINPSEPMATDEECDFALRANGQNPYLAAASLAESRAAHFLNRPVTTKRGERTTTYGDPVKGFLTLAATLRMQASTKTAFVYAGGLSVSEHQTDRGNRDLVQPFAHKDLMIRPSSPARVSPVFDPREEEGV